MAWYVVYRHGFHEANQSESRGQPEKMAVARIEADSPEQACKQAMREVILMANQTLSAELADELDDKEAEMNRTARTMGGTSEAGIL